MKQSSREDGTASVAEPRRNARTRRAFMKMIAAGSTALLVAGPARRSRAASSTKKPATAKAAAPDSTAHAAKPGTHVALAEEIEKQKKYTLDSVKKLRAYQLPAGSPQGFSFRPLPARRAHKGAR